MEGFINNSSLRWCKEDVFANTPDELGIQLTDAEAQQLLEDFFEEHQEWLTERINEAMREFLHSRLDSWEI